ncbi:peptidase S1 [Paraliobacillus quinghaiensis]|uniref:Peptidase S1 n=1 Tax=Paraliobacillus quinghaiensis TaxID=470815 RepID=A0A917TEV2_9BACI|nr:trypsin-like peptidase domain-containing protein [Paraliobacillus quinghaiensis]GGM20072.1 peptidase S1 [Paraliobacillus quinghaiensis]
MNKKIYLPILLSLIFISGAISMLFLIQNHWSSTPLKIENAVAYTKKETNTSQDLQTIIHETQKNVVKITVETDQSEKTGSGFLYNTNGDIITNAHVIKDAEAITVTMSNAETYQAAIVGIGDKKDIAVIRVPQLINQAPIDIATTNRLRVGDEIIALGSPLGFQNSVSLGIISGTNRSFQIDDFSYDNVFQISANITHGNSGGPLIDRTTGEVVGVNAAGIDDSGIAFSIPIEHILDDVREWSQSTSDSELIYPNGSFDTRIEPEQFQDDAAYLINYFFESILIRDYINAYALLGSSLQTDTTYTDFRENYIHHVSLEMNDMKTNYLKGKEQVVVDLTVTSVDVNSENKEKKLLYTFTVGYENDQLKIIHLEKQEVTD